MNISVGELRLIIYCISVIFDPSICKKKRENKRKKEKKKEKRKKKKEKKKNKNLIHVLYYIITHWTCVWT